MDRAALADFLRRHRDALQPADAGIPLTARRRTPGLRREDVAALALMSTDHYTLLEQQRGPQPSEPMLGSMVARHNNPEDDAASRAVTAAVRGNGRDQRHRPLRRPHARQARTFWSAAVTPTAGTPSRRPFRPHWEAHRHRQATCLRAVRLPRL